MTAGDPQHRPTSQDRLETLVQAEPAAAVDASSLRFESRTIVEVCQAPGQDRFAFLWDDLVDGALGAIVLVDTRRVEDCFPAVDYFEERDIPFLLAVNQFDNAQRFDLGEVREALGFDDRIPVVECDARVRASVKEVLVLLIEQIMVVRLGGFQLDQLTS